MKKYVSFLLLAAVFTQGFSQDWRVNKMVQAKKSVGTIFEKIPAFRLIGDQKLPGHGIYQQLRLDPTFLNSILQNKPGAMQIILPLSNRNSIICELVRFSLGNVNFTENNNATIDNVKKPVTYRGIVAGEQSKNNVMLTVNADYVSLLVVMNDKNLQVTQADEMDKSLYRLYNSAEVKFPSIRVDCGTKEKSNLTADLGIDLSGVYRPGAVQDKCVNVFIDCFDSLFQFCNSNRQQTINFVYELYTSATTGYYNEGVNLQITTINIWTTADPYRGDTRENALADLATYWKDNFWGNICVGLDFGKAARAGVADDIGRVKAVSANTCPAYDYSGGKTQSACCYSDLNYNVTVQGFPTGLNTTQSQVYSVMHEMGHLLGVNHTKWCGWKLTTNPDTFGALDSCGPVEGTCAKGLPPGSGGATIMSYCTNGSTPNDFVGFNNGFGLLPGNALRNFVDLSVCIINCSDCFGSLNRSTNDELAFYSVGTRNKRGHNRNGYTNVPHGSFLFFPKN
jgi:hypothetical protein